MVSQSINSYSSYFKIFASQIIFGDKGLDFITHRLVYRTLTGDCRKARGLSAATSLLNRTTISR